MTRKSENLETDQEKLHTPEKQRDKIRTITKRA